MLRPTHGWSWIKQGIVGQQESVDQQGTLEDQQEDTTITSYDQVPETLDSVFWRLGLLATRSFG